MLKKTIVAVLATFGALSAFAAEAANSLECAPPVLQVPSTSAKTPAQFTINCVGANHHAIAPSVTFAGEMAPMGTPPYRVTSTYTVDIRDLATRKLQDVAREDQTVTGTVDVSTLSVAALPGQLVAQTQWDAHSGTLSVEERPGRWHIFSLQLFQGAADASLVDAGYASVPFANGHATAKLVFGKEYSRFAGKTDSLPVVNAELGLRDGKLELQVGESRVTSQAAVQGALLQLDRKPKDISRAWALASRAKFLGLEDEVRYAEQKVAAHNPQLLDDFQHDLQGIKPYILPMK